MNANGGRGTDFTGMGQTTLQHARFFYEVVLMKMETSTTGQMTEETSLRVTTTTTTSDLVMNMADNREMKDSLGQFEEAEGRKCKLSIFQSNHFCSQSTAGGPSSQDSLLEEPELLLHHDDFPYLNVGDIVEIYQPNVDAGADDTFPRLFLMVS